MNLKAVLMWVIFFLTGCGYDLSFGYEYKLFESSNPVCHTAGEN